MTFVLALLKTLIGLTVSTGRMRLGLPAMGVWIVL